MLPDLTPIRRIPRQRLHAAAGRRPLQTCACWILALVMTCSLTASVAATATSFPVGSSPLAFERNEGQLDEPVRYVARGSGYQAFFTSDGARIVKRDGTGASVVDVRASGSRRAAPEASEPLPQRTNYIRGERGSDRFTDIANFARIAYRSVYPGVDLVYYGTGGELEYDFVVASHADPTQIRLAFEGMTGISISDAAPNLLIT